LFNGPYIHQFVAPWEAMPSAKTVGVAHSSYRPILRISSTLIVLWILLLSLVTVGYNSVLTYSHMVKICSNRHRWTRLFNARLTHLQSSITHKYICYELLKFTHHSGKAEPQCQATPIEFGSPHEAICTGFVDICLPILHSY
jgi:hypothetical protein